MDICLALGGGGIKGLAHIGVIDRLEAAGFRIRSIAGTSVGGLVGAVYSAGYAPREILALIESLNPNRLYARQPTDRPSLLGYTGLADVLVDVLGESTFADLKIQFACTAVDTKTTHEVYLSEGRVLDAVLAAIAIPGVFPPQVRGSSELVDGGILDPVPVNLARCMNPRLPVIAVALNPDRSEWHRIPQFNIVPPPSLPIPAPIIEGFSRMRIGQAMRMFLHSMDITARMLTELKLEVDKPDVIIRPDVHDYGMLDMVEPVKLVEAGRLAVDDALPSVHKSLSWPNTIARVLRSPARPQGVSLPCKEDSHPPAVSSEDEAA